MAKLLEELRTDKILFRNRLIMPPMATRHARDDGKLSEEIVNYYTEKAEGGYLSLIITEHSYISPIGRAGENQISIASEDTVAGLSKLVSAIHASGTKAVAQLNHAGARGLYGEENKAPSAIHSLGEFAPGKDWIAGRELSGEEIAGIVAEFAAAAVRAKKAGYDGVEIHSAHGYLLDQFYSPLTNQRTDGYGGDILGRIRIHLEVIAAVREAVGDAYPIFLRLGASDYLEGGSSIADAVIAAGEFEKAGVDILDISGGLYGYTVKGREGEQGYYKDASTAIKQAVSIPVILTGGITEAYAAEKLLEEGAADLIGVGRAVYRDSGWAEHAVGQLGHSKK